MVFYYKVDVLQRVVCLNTYYLIMLSWERMRANGNVRLDLSQSLSIVFLRIAKQSNLGENAVFERQRLIHITVLVIIKLT